MFNRNVNRRNSGGQRLMGEPLERREFLTADIMTVPIVDLAPPVCLHHDPYTHPLGHQDRPSRLFLANVDGEDPGVVGNLDRPARTFNTLTQTADVKQTEPTQRPMVTAEAMDQILVSASKHSASPLTPSFPRGSWNSF